MRFFTSPASPAVSRLHRSTYLAPRSQVGFWGEDGGLAWEEWAAGKADEAGFSERVVRDQNGRPPVRADGD